MKKVTFYEEWIDCRAFGYKSYTYKLGHHKSKDPYIENEIPGYFFIKKELQNLLDKFEYAVDYMEDEPEYEFSKDCRNLITEIRNEL